MVGIQKVKTKYALLLNPDIKFLTKNPIYNFEQSIKQYSNVGMASCITCNENMEKENGRITFFSKIDKKILKDIIEIPEGNACNIWVGEERSLRQRSHKTKTLEVTATLGAFELLLVIS